MKFYKRKYILNALAVMLLVTSCKKFLGVGNPVDKVTGSYVYSDDATAAAVLTGIFYDLQNANRSGLAHGGRDISTLSSVISDECNILTDSPFSIYYTNSSSPDFWAGLYDIIYRTNRAIEGISASTSLSSDVKTHLLGEAKFVRAFCYFYLTNFYGDVPILTSSNFELNSIAARDSQEEVYLQIINDLSESQTLLTEDYLQPDMINNTNERVRPNKWAAKALLARVYLYTEKWSEAVAHSNSIIERNTIYDTVELNSVFLKDNKEAIWQLKPLSPDGLSSNTLFPDIFLFLEGQPDHDHSLLPSEVLLNSFEIGDGRKSHWIGFDSSTGTAYPFFWKYKYFGPGTDQNEFIVVLRLTEQYLIRAEAKTQLGDLSGAASDINIIRRRAGLPDLPPLSSAQILNEIMRERQVEFFTEWGHRWLDLKRTKKINEVMEPVTAVKGGMWESYKQLLQIPIDDIKYNPNMVQNDGWPSF